MRVFIWGDVDKVSPNYHEGGGLVVFAGTEERARALANECEHVELRDDEPVTVVLDVSSPEAVFVFPNAGCC